MTGAAAEGARLVRLMRELAIVQRGDPILTRRDLAPFDLPAEIAEAQAAVAALTHKADEITRRYNFHGRGMGLAAPQIGLARRVALVRPPRRADQIVLLNPLVVDRGPDLPAEFFEGCLSFFGVRGRVPRPGWIVIEHDSPRGISQRSAFDGLTARLLTHELDHLDGILYPERMPATERLVPVEEYRRMDY